MKRVYKGKRTKAPKKTWARAALALTSLNLRGNLGGIPDKYTVNLRFVDNIAVSSNAVEKFIFRGAGAYDPKFALGGPSCINWPIFQALYSKYRGISSNIKIEYTDAIGATHPVTCAVGASNNATQFTGIQQIIQSPYTKHRTQTEYPAFPLTVKNSMTAKRVRGAKRLDKDSYESFTNNNPPDDWYWTVFFHSHDGTTPLAGQFRVTMNYRVTFFDRKEAIHAFHTAESDLCYGPTGYGGVGGSLIDDSGAALLLNGESAQQYAISNTDDFNPIPEPGCTGPNP